MSQNDKILLAKGVPVLTHDERNKLRGKWQAQTWDDMLLSLHNYGKYVMLRPTGFGKTFTCAAACNIGLHKGKNNTLRDDEIRLHNGNVFIDKKLASIKNKKVVFVYVSEILKNTFDEYVKKGTISNGRDRVIYETYASVALHWNDKDYLLNTLGLKDVGLVIFDEVQRMGAVETSKALEVAIPLFEELGIYYIGATATPERTTGYDVIDKYFRHDWKGGKHDYCWGEHLYTLKNAFESGLIIPPEYQYIVDDPKRIRKYRGELRQTRLSMMTELKTMAANNPERDVIIDDMKYLQRAVIKDADKIIHDTMIKLYDCGNKYLTNEEELTKVNKGTIEKPERLPSYMRFLVFTPSQEDMKAAVKVDNTSGVAKIFENMVSRTYNDFHNAFGRYGYKVRVTIISSANNIERENVNLIDPDAEVEAEIKKKRKLISDDEASDIIVKQEAMTIDLIFSINMLNVGYHVNNITGLVFKRWTGSNQIYLQQLGRCLSSVSETIPVVFDFVNTIDDRGINAPLYTYDDIRRKVTENADGTQDSIDNNPKKRKAVKIGTYNKIVLDNMGNSLPLDTNGKPVNPQLLNKIDSEFIIMETESASIDKLLSRANVYQTRLTAKKLHSLAYDKYISSFVIRGKQIDASHSMRLEDSLKLAIYDTDKKAASSRGLTMNFKAYIEMLSNTEKDLFVLYDALAEYVKGTLETGKFKALSSEVNSILAASKTVTNKHGAHIKLVIQKDKVEDFKKNKDVINLLKEKGFNPSTDLYYYV